jgi:hypothetical protein
VDTVDNRYCSYRHRRTHSGAVSGGSRVDEEARQMPVEARCYFGYTRYAIEGRGK